MTIFINIVLILVSIVLIVAVLMQEGNKQGLGAIGGGAETFFGKNKAKSYEGKLVLITKIGAAVFIVLAIVATILNSTGASKDETADVITDGEPAVEEIVDDAEETAEEVTEAAEETVEAAEETVEEAVETVTEAAEETVEETAETAVEAAEEAVEETTEG